jgi:hypothetical protein
MKSTQRSRKRVGSNELRPEYQFDYDEAKQNRFAPQMGPGTVTVVLDPDVAAVFNSSQSVNILLRSVIKAVPRVGASATRRRKAG